MTQSELAQELAELSKLPRTDLVVAWVKVYGHPPPKGINRGFLERVCAYRIQARRLRPLKPSIRKRLLAHVTPSERDEGTAPPIRPTVRPGAKLLREWNGVTHQVLVTEQGCEWNGHQFSSLSAVAKAITGAHWSGPRFFGL
ncbi:MAG: DUF2924 domain-containing protein [Pseudomonadota bacterium]